MHILNFPFRVQKIIFISMKSLLTKKKILQQDQRKNSADHFTNSLKKSRFSHPLNTSKYIKREINRYYLLSQCYFRIILKWNSWIVSMFWFIHLNLLFLLESSLQKWSKCHFSHFFPDQPKFFLHCLNAK